MPGLPDCPRCPFATDRDRACCCLAWGLPVFCHLPGSARRITLEMAGAWPGRTASDRPGLPAPADQPAQARASRLDELLPPEEAAGAAVATPPPPAPADATPDRPAVALVLDLQSLARACPHRTAPGCGCSGAACAAGLGDFDGGRTSSPANCLACVAAARGPTMPGLS